MTTSKPARKLGVEWFVAKGGLVTVIDTYIYKCVVVF